MKLVIADSNDIVRVGLRTILGTEKNIEIIGEAKDSQELKQIIKNFDPTLVLIDYTSAGFNIDVVPKIKTGKII